MRFAAVVALGFAVPWCAPAEAPGADVQRPSYHRVDGDIETLWQRPSSKEPPKGILFIAHGCNHQGTDVFSDVEIDGWRFEACAQSNYGSCLGLPEEVRLRQVARDRGYLVVAVSGGRGVQSCWDQGDDEEPGDALKVAKALRYVLEAERLPADLPVLAMGASSGGAFMGRLASLEAARGGVLNLRCIVPQIMDLGDIPRRKVPTLFVHMPRDKRTAREVADQIEQMKVDGFRVAEIRVEPRPVTAGLLQRCYGEKEAAKALKAMGGDGLLDERGFLVEDPRSRNWDEAVVSALGVTEDSLKADASCLAEELNIAWARHELTAQYANEQLDFCEGQDVVVGGVSESVEQEEARVRNTHRSRAGVGGGQMGGVIGGHVGPAWTFDPSVERPAGTESKGTYSVAVYTEEQQARLGVDRWGKPAAHSGAPAKATPAASLGSTSLQPAPAAFSPLPPAQAEPPAAPEAAQAGQSPDEQVLIFDAGSSGTRVHVYNMYAGARVPMVDLSVAAAQTSEVKPGLSAFAERGDLEGAQQSIEKLLAFADQLIAPAHRGTTPLLLKATAGLRAVPAEKADAILQRARSTLSDSGYFFQSDWAGIIQGKEEAGLAWVAANYLQGTFANLEGSTSSSSSSFSSSSSTSSTTPSSSIGVIELGGGSMQVSFQLSDAAAPIAEDDLFIFREASGLEYRLYAHSYLGFGMDAARKRAQAAVSAESASEDPCYPTDYRRGEGLDAVTGAGDAQRCQALFQRTVFSAADAPGRYSHEQSAHGDFVAISNFFYTLRDLRLPMASQVSELEQRAAEACAGSLRPPDGAQRSPCFELSYQAALLRALRVPAQPGVRFHVAGQIGGVSPDWALGAALVHSLQNGRLSLRGGRGGSPGGRKPFPWPAAAVAVFVLGSVSLMLRNFLLGKSDGVERQMKISPIAAKGNDQLKRVRPTKLGRIGVSRYSGYDRASPTE